MNPTEKVLEPNHQRLEKLKEKFFQQLDLKGLEKDLARLFIRQISTSLAELDFIGKESIEAFLPVVVRMLTTKTPEKTQINIFNFKHYDVPKTVLMMRRMDSPFIVDSISNYLRNQSYEISFLMHPILAIERDQNGTPISIKSPSEKSSNQDLESVVVIVLSKVLMKDQFSQLKQGLERVVSNIDRAVSDWGVMRERSLEAVSDIENGKKSFTQEDYSEICAFLSWVESGNFTFLGYREYSFKKKKAVLREALGIARDQKECFFHINCLLEDQEDYLPSDKLFLITKTIARSVVHRNVPMDVIRLKIFNAAGDIIGEREFIGLFTSTAYTLSIKSIPILRKKLNSFLQASDMFLPSYTGKVLVHILETLPRDELFQFSEGDLTTFVHQILQLQERKRVLLYVRKDPLSHLISGFVYIPTEKYSGALREKIQVILEDNLNAQMSSYHPNIDPDLPYVWVVFSFVKDPLQDQKIQLKDLQKKIETAAKSWEDSLEQLIDRSERAYQRAFSKSYQLDFTPEEALDDIQHSQECALKQKPLVKLGETFSENKGVFSYRIKIFNLSRSIPLTDIMPVFEMLGLKVFTEETYRIKPEDITESIYLHDFFVESACANGVDFEKSKSFIEQGIQEIVQGVYENDFLNALIIDAGILVNEVNILRAYFKYLKQIHFPYSLRLVTRSFSQNASLTKKLIQLFEEQFSLKGSKPKLKKIYKEVEEEIQALESQEDDRVFRSFLTLINATLRTNYFKEDQAPYLIFKFECEKIIDLPEPKPELEFFIYHKDFEATHLRTGKVARGGLRWSDRIEDFRTEVLSLMKAQKVKNTIIVPVGAKGGFVIKKSLEGMDRKEKIAFGVHCYKTMIQAMLDVTDNMVQGKPKHPKKVKCYDGFDPYLVVAADKGTATFSDYANEISIKNNFWLGDAFASGGSHGYDHKKMGITAKGAWESVQHHFRQIGHDVQKTPFQVIGVGDMSGDVFGNGMLCSDKIKLVAAFNHLHIFIDPNPDVAVSYKERERLFKLPSSNWEDYDKTLLSEGGAIYSRRDKKITLSKAAQRALKLSKAQMAPNELIKEILKAPVDLLWFGGIGTYVKASDETDQQAGDRANDSVRVNGRQLRCKVIGEGANLGMTQKARVEFALKGGLLNTDAIDNSAGVDCSDHEVNIKILLKALQEKEGLTDDKRNSLLSKMTDEVSDLVLKNNSAQNNALSLIQVRGADLLGRQERFMKLLERQGYLDRKLEFLPDEEELKLRKSKQIGLTRPELAVLLAYGKLFAHDVILKSALPDVSYLESKLLAYFPSQLNKKYVQEILQHPLKREIIATLTCNELVNRQGPTYLAEVMRITQEEPANVILNYFVARDSLGVLPLNQKIQELGVSVPFKVQQNLLLALVEVVEYSTLWLTFNQRKMDDLCSDIDTYSENVSVLGEVLEGFLTSKEKKEITRDKATLMKNKVPEEMAQRIVLYQYIKYVWPITNISFRTNVPFKLVAELFFKINSVYFIDWLRKSCQKVRNDDPWRKKNLRLIVRELDTVHERLAERILREVKGVKDVSLLLKRWEKKTEVSTQLYHKTMNELMVPKNVSVDMVAIGFNALMEFSKI